MEQIVRIRRLCPDGKAEVYRVRESACSGDCHKCSGCGAAQETVTVEADNPIGARPGDLVRIQSDTKSVMGAVMVFYGLPLVLFFAGYALGCDSGWGGLGGGIGVILGIAVAAAYDRLYARKNRTVYTIVGYAADGY